MPRKDAADKLETFLAPPEPSKQPGDNSTEIAHQDDLQEAKKDRKLLN
jgi:hypothetical protein